MSNPYTAFLIAWLIVAIVTIIYAQYKHDMVSYMLRYYERRFHMFADNLADEIEGNR